MKKSQRLRLAALVAKDQATLTADEKTELATLQALALANPDASKDTEDAAAIAPTFRGFIQSLRTGAQTGADLVTARATIATLTTNLAAANQTITARDGTIATLTAQVDAFAAFFGITAAELANKPAAEVTKLIQAKISDQALEQVAALGVPPGDLPAATKQEGDAKQMSYAEFQKLTPAAKMKFSSEGGRLVD